MFHVYTVPLCQSGCVFPLFQIAFCSSFGGFDGLCFGKWLYLSMSIYIFMHPQLTQNVTRTSLEHPRRF